MCEYECECVDVDGCVCECTCCSGGVRHHCVCVSIRVLAGMHACAIYAMHGCVCVFVCPS